MDKEEEELRHRRLNYFWGLTFVICGVIILIGAYLLVLTAIPYFDTNSMLLTTCFITHGESITNSYEDCISSVYMYYVNYTYPNSNGILQSIISTYSQMNNSFSCSASNKKQYVLSELSNPVGQDGFITGIILMAVGILVLVITRLLYKKLNQKISGIQPDEEYYHRLVSYLITPVFLIWLIVSLVFMGRASTGWIQYQSGQCRLLNNNFTISVTKNQDCSTMYLLTQNVFIMDTGTNGIVNYSEDDPFLITYLIAGKFIGGIYPCFYKQTDVLWVRDPYVPWLLSAIICLILGIVSAFWTKLRRIFFLRLGYVQVT